MIGAQHAHRVFRAFDIAAEPGKIFGGAAGQAARQAAAEIRACARQQRIALDGIL